MRVRWENYMRPRGISVFQFLLLYSSLGGICSARCRWATFQFLLLYSYMSITASTSPMMNAFNSYYCILAAAGACVAVIAAVLSILIIVFELHIESNILFRTNDLSILIIVFFNEIQVYSNIVVLVKAFNSYYCIRANLLIALMNVLGSLLSILIIVFRVEEAGVSDRQHYDFQFLLLYSRRTL